MDMARLAARWAPADPLTHWKLGNLKEQVFSAENMAEAVREYQLAVTLSPYDYRYWMELGRALEGVGDRENGEKALRRAVDLAPAYSHPRWHYGNLLLREGKLAEAFQQLGHAAEADDEMRPRVFGLAMQVFDGDVNEIARTVSVSATARMQFAVHLASTGKIDEALQIWATVSPGDRRAHSQLAQELRQSFVSSKQFRALLVVMRETDPDASLPQLEQITNGGFEKELSVSNELGFDWAVTSRSQAQIRVDSQAHSGNGSLRILFRVPNTLDKIPVSQTVIVQPGAAYRFECFVRTDKLITSSGPLLTIHAAIDNSLLAASTPVPSGTSDWQKVTFDFKTNPKSDGIVIGLSRAPCVEAQICPIFGTVWYDDFSLQRIDGPGSSRRESGSAKH